MNMLSMDQTIINTPNVLGYVQKRKDHNGHTIFFQDGRGLPPSKTYQQEISTLLTYKKYFDDLPLGVIDLKIQKIGAHEIVYFDTNRTRPGYYMLYDDKQKPIEIAGLQQFNEIKSFDDIYLSCTGRKNNHTIHFLYNKNNGNILSFSDGNISPIALSEKEEGKKQRIRKKDNQKKYLIDNITDTNIVTREIEGVIGFDKVAEDQFGVLILGLGHMTYIVDKEIVHKIDHTTRLKNMRYDITDDYGNFVFKDREGKQYTYIINIDFLYDTKTPIQQTHLGDTIVAQDIETAKNELVILRNTADYRHISNVTDITAIDSEENILIIQKGDEEVQLHGFTKSGYWIALLELPIHTDVIKSVIHSKKEIKNLENLFKGVEDDIHTYNLEREKLIKYIDIIRENIEKEDYDYRILIDYSEDILSDNFIYIGDISHKNYNSSIYDNKNIFPDQQQKLEDMKQYKEDKLKEKNNEKRKIINQIDELTNFVKKYSPKTNTTITSL